MLTLTKKILDSLDNYVYQDFGGLDEFRKLITEVDLIRLLTHNLDVVIIKPWDLNINLVDLHGHLPTYPIEIYNVNYKLLQSFPPSGVFGSQEHIAWLETNTKHGQQLYLKVRTLTQIKLILCIVCKEIPNYLRTEYVKVWLSNIYWNVNKPIVNQGYLTFEPKLPTIKTIKLFYVPLTTYNPSIKLEHVIDNNDVSVSIVTTDYVISLPSLRTGYYAIALEEQGDNSLTWLKLTNVQTKGNYLCQYINGLNFIKLNDSQRVDLNNPNTVLTGDFELAANLIPAYSNKTVSITITNSTEFDYNQINTYWAFILHEPSEDLTTVTASTYRNTGYYRHTFKIDFWAEDGVNIKTLTLMKSLNYSPSLLGLTFSKYSIWAITPNPIGVDKVEYVTKGTLTTNVTTLANELLELEELKLLR